MIINMFNGRVIRALICASTTNITLISYSATSSQEQFYLPLIAKNALGSSMAIRGCLFKMKLFKKPRVLGQKSYASVTALAG